MKIFLSQESIFCGIRNSLEEEWEGLEFTEIQKENNHDVERQKSSYRVSHSKDEKVILLWWGYRFWFLLIFSILQVHEIGTFMFNSSVFIFLILCALYRMICKYVKSFLCENSLNVTNAKLFSKFFFGNLGVFLTVFWFCSLI